MRKAWARLQAWLRREAYVRAAVCEASKNAYLAGHAEGLATGQQAGYQVGLAQGELIGRDALALELQRAYGSPGGERDMTAEELANLMVRQVH